MEPVEMTETGTTLLDPNRTIDPFPNCLSNWTSV